MSVGSQKLMSLIDREGPVQSSTISDKIVEYIKYSLGRDKKTIDQFGMYQATAASVRNYLIDNWQRTSEEMERTKAKQVCYLSLEFLMGRMLANCIMNLELEDKYANVMEELGFKIEEIESEEMDAGLGNGGLGRLAACFLDSMACMEIPAWGYGLRYNYGMFKQTIKDGYQVETPEYWLRHGTPFPEVERLDIVYKVHFYGNVITVQSPEDPDKKISRWINTDTVKAVAYDCLCPGHHTRNVVNLRLWSARPETEFRFDEHSKGDYISAVRDKAMSENITQVLYPNDNSETGKVLRLQQEYFFVSASLQDIIFRAKEMGVPFEELGNHFNIQLNDTHPTLGIPELCRILVDEYYYDIRKAYEISKTVFAYTNHTVLPEALEKWPVPLIEKLLPRHMQIIYEINSIFMDEVSARFPGEVERLTRMSIIEESHPKMVRMANLAIIGSHHVNGVAKLHTEIIKESIFRDFYEMKPEMFVNVTNGVTPRRWIAHCNKDLRSFITKNLTRLGVISRECEWIDQMTLLKNLAPLSNDVSACSQILKMKRAAKERLAAYIEKETGVVLNPDMMFDTQVKRIHEYKRQLLFIFEVILRYITLKAMKPEEREGMVKRAAIFGGKAAPGYDRAKRCIRLITGVQKVINEDPDTKEYLKCVFVPNYCVSNAELIFPATDVSEQISTAGHEASGTGCMKAVMNGGVIIGTLDGANVEIAEEVGDDNIFIFGATTPEVNEMRAIFRNGDSLEVSENLRSVISTIRSGIFGDPSYFAPLVDDVAAGHDYYLICLDFDSYVECREYMESKYKDRLGWAATMIRCISRMSYFSSDRSIADYCEKIWHVKPMAILQHRGGIDRVDTFMK